MRTTVACGALLVWALGVSAGATQMPGPAPAGPPGVSTSQASQLPLYATRQNVFAIPFTPDRRIAQPVEVHLYVSRDQGGTWQLSDRQTPGARQFTFRSRGDGEYWFASRTLDASQQASSQGPLRPELRVQVDTTPPRLDLTVRTGNGGDVLAHWQVADENVLPGSLRIEYQEDDAQGWKTVTTPTPAEGSLRTSFEGQTSWSADTRSPTINVRAEVRDRAGNLTVASRRLLLPLQSAPAPDSRPHAGSVARAVEPPANPGLLSQGAVTWPSDNILPPAAAPSVSPLNMSPAPSLADQPPAAEHLTGRLASVRGDGPTTPPPVDPAHPAVMQPPGPFANPLPPAADPPLASTPPTQPDPPTRPSGPAADLMPLVAPGATADASAPNGPVPAGERPQMTKATRFQLSYDVDAEGPSGVAEVQLWATADGGQTWRLWGTDDDLQSPFDVVVEQEGVFGFQVVVVGRNGLVGRKPRTGDLADIYVGVDTVPPKARLITADYGQGAQAGKLLIRWEAQDAYLDPRPITLKFAEEPTGPWTVIASALPNSGEFAWPADAQIPPAIYLQLEVRDEAGNITTDQLSDPVHLDGLAPKARIRGIQPIQDVDREAFRQPRRG